MVIPVYQIDAFTDRPFAGNPAAVCVLHESRSAEWMQSVAAEMNLSETAFVRRLEDGFELRWFTPTVEVDLCGHATLASAHALWSQGHAASGQPLRFHTRSGVLTCLQIGNLIQLDFPSTPATAREAPPGFLEALNVRPHFLGKSKLDNLLVVESAEVVRTLKPDFLKLKSMLGARGVIVSSLSDDPRYDFISRYFAPGLGIDEDPVTGSAHCTLAPYWAQQLNKASMIGYQASLRGGTVYADLAKDRVLLRGQAVTVIKGELLVD
jgi:predicted PhzF superfamily epimerase YddE/YHI9